MWHYIANWFRFASLEEKRSLIADQIELARPQVELAQQRFEAAEALWAQGHTAEGYRLLADSWRLLRDGTRTLTSETTDTAAATFAKLGIPTSKHLETVVAPFDAGPIPTLASDVNQGTYDNYEALSRVLPMLLARTRDLVCTPAQLRRKKIERASYTGFLLLLVLIALVWKFKPGPAVTMRASNVMGDGRSAAENVMDGLPSTSWQMENGVTGWLELRLRSEQTIRKFWLTNDLNPPWNDRATRRYRIELKQGDRIVKTINGEFTFTTDPQPVEVPVPGGANHVDTIRFVVESHYEVGGGLAEIRWE